MAPTIILATIKSMRGYESQIDIYETSELVTYFFLQSFSHFLLIKIPLVVGAMLSFIFYSAFLLLLHKPQWLLPFFKYVSGIYLMGALFSLLGISFPLMFIGIQIHEYELPTIFISILILVIVYIIEHRPRDINSTEKSGF
jgi:hypothetical protein